MAITEPIPRTVSSEVVNPIGETAEKLVANSLEDIAKGVFTKKETIKPRKRRLTFFDIQETPDGFEVTIPGGYSDIGAIATYSKTARTREEAEQILQDARDNFTPRIEMASLRKSFSSFHAIQIGEDSKYSVTFPALRSLDNPNFLVGTSRKIFDTWEEAKDFYLEARNGSTEKPREADTLSFKIEDIVYTFEPLATFGHSARLADHPLSMVETMKKVVDFDTKRSQIDNVNTYQETLKINQWEGKIFYFVEQYCQTPKGQQILDHLGIKDLSLLTPQQATRLTLEIVTHSKKYSLADLDIEGGKTHADQNDVLVLLNSGLHFKGNTDYDGNGVCRNFAAATVCCL